MKGIQYLIFLKETYLDKIKQKKTCFQSPNFKLKVRTQ